jgi:hypothetical protein
MTYPSGMMEGPGWYIQELLNDFISVMYRVGIKYFPDYRHYKKTTVRGIQTYFFKCNSRRFFTTHLYTST